jgi:WD40 repeat protein
MVAVLPVSRNDFDRRASDNGKVSSFHILVWHFSQMVRPHLILESPYELSCFHFNPSRTNYVVGGCSNGQVVVWDISQSLKVNPTTKRGRRGGSSSSSSSSSSHPSNENESNQEKQSIQKMQPIFISYIESSHKKTVRRVRWLATDAQVNAQGSHLPQEVIGSFSQQFLSVSEDGNVLVWDLRFKEISEGDYPSIAKSKVIQVEKTGGNAQIPLFSPIRRVQVKRTQGVGDMTLCQCVCNLHESFKDNQEESLPGDEQELSRELLLSTVEGDLVHATLASSSSHTSSSDRKEEEKDEENDLSYDLSGSVLWMGMDHTSPTIALEQSPFFPNIFLSVSSWKFQVWQKGVHEPLISSPIQTNNAFTIGFWSPTKPSIIFTGLEDGSVSVWDLTDSSSHPSLELQASHSPISSAQFLEPKRSRTQGVKKQLLATGDSVGTLHIYDIPTHLSRPLHNEFLLVKSFFHAQKVKLNYDGELDLVRSHGGGTKEESKVSQVRKEQEDGNSKQRGNEEIGLSNWDDMDQSTEDAFSSLLLEVNELMI